MHMRELDETLLMSSVYNSLGKCGPNKQKELKLLAEYVTNLKCLSHTHQISKVLGAPSVDDVLKGITTD